ncbi:hypothetical protein VTJ83DRAFT_689 [Remersonia thermophila]|uniref:Thioredoxin-like fold domain-containing protein n=1 Tax=Remersonia thermophila TaxID=72144 RepID=A0ABR4DLN4_9PEZI
MALPPKFKGHRLTFTDAAGPASEPLHTIEVYIDYVCPFSAKIFRTLTGSVIPYIRSRPALAARTQIILRQQIQPWHPSSTLVHEAALAVQRVASARGDASSSAAEVAGLFWAFSAALFAAQAGYFDEAVAAEPRNATYRRLAALARESAGLDEEAVFALLRVPEGPGEAKNAGNGVTADVKTIVKMARLTGVHVTPTVLLDGVVVPEIGSAWTGEQWAEWLDKVIV